jgi:hypothetical protein
MVFSTPTANRCNSKLHQQTDTTSIHGVQHTHSQPLQQQKALTVRYNINTWCSAHPQPTAATANSISSQIQHQYMGFRTPTANRCNSKTTSTARDSVRENGVLGFGTSAANC